MSKPKPKPQPIQLPRAVVQAIMRRRFVWTEAAREKALAEIVRLNRKDGK